MREPRRLISERGLARGVRLPCEEKEKIASKEGETASQKWSSMSGKKGSPPEEGACV